MAAAASKLICHQTAALRDSLQRPTTLPARRPVVTAPAEARHRSPDELKLLGDAAAAAAHGEVQSQREALAGAQRSVDTIGEEPTRFLTREHQRGLRFAV